MFVNVADICPTITFRWYPRTRGLDWVYFKICKICISMQGYIVMYYMTNNQLLYMHLCNACNDTALVLEWLAGGCCTQCVFTPLHVCQYGRRRVKFVAAAACSCLYCEKALMIVSFYLLHAETCPSINFRWFPWMRGLNWAGSRLCEIYTILCGGIVHFCGTCMVCMLWNILVHACMHGCVIVCNAWSNIKWLWGHLLLDIIMVL